MQRLTDAALAQLPAAVQRPGYDRTQLQSGIVHLGLGAFMRAHLAVATEAAINATGDLAWGITGVSLRSADTRDALAPQQGLYTVAVRSAAGQQLQVPGCLRQCLVGPENPAAVAEAIAAPETRIVSLTVTEKGYLPDSPTLGVLLQGLALRQARGLGGVTLLSLDNLPANGRVLQQRLLAQAGAQAGWITAHCSFPCSMVDRIVPRTTAPDRAAVSAALGCADAWPVLAEPFFSWVVEDRFAAGRPAWQHQPGVQVVADAAPFEALKLRMVNGSHSAIAYLGAVAGWATVDQAMAQPALRRYVAELMRTEVQPTLPPLPVLDVDAYRAELLQRFANPALAHRTQQIAMDGTQKLPQRLVATLAQRQAAGLASPRLVLALAAWLHYLRGHDEAGHAYPIDDPLAAELAALGPRPSAATALAYAPVFGALPAPPALVAALDQALAALRTQGVAASLENWG